MMICVSMFAKERYSMQSHSCYFKLEIYEEFGLTTFCQAVRLKFNKQLM